MRPSEFDSRLADLADAIELGPAPRIEQIEREARGLATKRRRRSLLVGVAAAAAACVAAPFVISNNSSDTGPSRPRPSESVGAPDERGSCASIAGTAGSRERNEPVLVTSDCATEPLQLDLGPDETAYSLAMSPDQTMVAYAVGTAAAADRLEVRDLATGDVRVVATSSDTIPDVAWSPDGTSLAIARMQAGVSEVLVADIDGGSLEPISRDPVGGSPSWSPDGAMLAYRREGGVPVVVTMATGQRRELAEAPLEASIVWGGDAIYSVEHRSDMDLDADGKIVSAQEFRVHRLDPQTGAIEQSSAWRPGQPSGTAADDDHVVVAALDSAGTSTTVTSYGSGLEVVDQQSITGIEITGLVVNRDQDRPATEEPPRSGVAGYLSELPTGSPPQLTYAVDGTSVVDGGRSVDLEWKVAAVSGDLVYDAVHGAIHQIGPHTLTLLTTDASSAPINNGVPMWIENDQQIAYTTNSPSQPQPLPSGCCTGARLIGASGGLVYVSSQNGAWVWDFDQGRTDGQPVQGDHDKFLWPISGLGAGSLAEAGQLDDVLVEYPDSEWGWGYVDVPEVPGSGDPAVYIEQERIMARRVWLTGTGEIVAIDDIGRLAIRHSEIVSSPDDHLWRQLTGTSTELEMPTDLAVASVAAESPRTVLVDATDSSGRFWVRCDVGAGRCEVAVGLGPNDLTSQ